VHRDGRDVVQVAEIEAESSLLWKCRAATRAVPPSLPLRRPRAL
jgi:hypothetical protein